MNIRVSIDGYLSPEKFREFVARVVKQSTVQTAELVRENFARLDKARNRHGSHFYEQEGAQATNYKATPTSGEVVVNSYKMAHKLYGGTVRPVRTRFLAIPAADRFYGKMPRAYGDKVLVFQKTRKGGLLKDRRTGEVAYWLVKEVTHKARPETLPSEALVRARVEKAIADVIFTFETE